MPDIDTFLPDSADGDQIASALQSCREALPDLSLKDERRIKKNLRSIEQRLAKGLAVDRKVKQVLADVSAARDKLAQKQSALPNIEYPSQLPVSERREEILAKLSAHQVVIIAGETGSGKTTQIPKMCLELGWGIRGLIGHTQPRRIAARTVASRIAQELKLELGATVGYQVRFQDSSDERTCIKLMTDGILLAEIQRDPMLLAYECIIIDEAHERSLNIDFLLGYLKQLLPKRPDLKVIVTSATIDVARFSKHFNDAPTIEVSGRTYPVETRYRPWHEYADDINDAVVLTLQEIVEESRGQGGDVLIFLSGERDIRALSLAIKKSNLAGLDVLPLYARLNLAEQNRVFQGSRSRKVVLATNVAETSITVPGIRYVIDTGIARISRYSLRTKVQRLPIEAISQASANQRQGRCGRVGNGVCYRLYSEEDFLSRAEYTDPELLRTNLAAVVLQMLQLNIGKVENFPFVDQPDARLIKDGYRLLQELQAVDPQGRINAIGKRISKLSLDPKFARMLLDADKLACLNEVLVIVAALTLQDPRERPTEKQQAADQCHRRFADEKSDFIAYVNLWHYAEQQRQELSQNQFRKLCKREYLNFMRLKEWRELHHQLKVQAAELGLKINTSAASFEAIHQALLVGLLSNVARRDEEEGSREYIGTRSRKCLIFPGSGLRKKKYSWVLAADFIETSQVFAHCIAKIDPKWVVERAQHVVKHHYSEPHYEVRSGSVKAFDKISLWGLVLSEKTRVDYAKINRELSREIFIREALVEQKYRGKGEFFKHNQKVIAEVQDLEAKSRRRDILVDDEAIFSFYNECIPADVCSRNGLEFWLKKTLPSTPDLLKLRADQVMLHDAGTVSESQFPDSIKNGDFFFSVKYEFEPTRKNDGLNVRVPVDLLHVVVADELDWLVPGLLRDKCCALIKTLPKQLRKHFVPVPATVDKLLGRMPIGEGALLDTLSEHLKYLSQVDIADTDWRPELLDDFYTANIVVVDENDQVIDQSRDIEMLRQRYREKVRGTLEDIGTSYERSGIELWDIEHLPQSIELKRGSAAVRAYPALVSRPNRGSVDLKLYDNPVAAQVDSNRAICRLALNANKQQLRDLSKTLLRGRDIGLTMVDLGDKNAVVEDILLAAMRRACFDGQRVISVSNKTEFDAALKLGRGHLAEYCDAYEQLLHASLLKVLEIKKKIKTTKNALAMAMCFGDIQKQLSALFYPGFLFDAPWEWLQHLPRYLDAILLRMDKAPQKPQADRVGMLQVQALEDLHQKRLDKKGKHAFLCDQAWMEYRWLLEELRVSLFAQTLKTARPVSEKRLKKYFAELK